MLSLPLGSTHSRTMLGVACHHGPWTTYTVERRRAWHAIIALGRQTGSNDVRRGMPSSLLNQLTQSDGVGRGMPSSPQDGKHSRTTSRVACHTRLWKAHKVGRRRAWHAITSLEQYTRSDDVGHGMQLPPLDSTHGRMTFGVASHHCPWTARTVGRRQAWHAITALGLHAHTVGRRRA